MELAHLRSFVAVSRERNIARGAESLRLTPSPVSRTIRQLEEELGGELFTRAYHDLELTDLGDRTLPHAVRAVEEAGEVTRIALGKQRELEVGATPWAPSRYAEQLLALAGADAQVTTDLSSRLLHLMRHGELDAAIVHLPVPFPGILTRPLAVYNFRVFAHPDHDFGGRDEITLAELAGAHLVTMPSTMQPAAMAPMNDRLRAAGLTDLTELDLSDWVTAPQVLRRTGGVMLGMRTEDSPFSAFMAAGHLTSIPLARGEIEFTLGVAWRENHTDPRVATIAGGLHPLVGEPIDELD